MSKKTIHEGPDDGAVRKAARTIEDEGPEYWEIYRADTDTWERLP